MFNYPVDITHLDNGDVMVSFPDIPEAMTYGDNEDFALAMGTRRSACCPVQLYIAMGFQASQWEVLAQALKAQAVSGTVSSAVESPYGTRYTVDGPIETPDRRSPMPRIRTVWVEEPTSADWRLVTAYPL